MTSFFDFDKNYHYAENIHSSKNMSDNQYWTVSFYYYKQAVMHTIDAICCNLHAMPMKPHMTSCFQTQDSSIT